jgi:hypothetical protein
MAFVKRTLPTKVANAAVYLSHGTRQTYQIDLSERRCAQAHIRIGRAVSTVLPVAVRCNTARLQANGAMPSAIVPDVLSTMPACNQDALTAAAAAGAMNLTVANTATPYAYQPGDNLCLRSNDALAQRVEFVTVAFIASGTSLALVRPLQMAHNTGDVITTQPVSTAVELAGGHVWDITAVNPSGQPAILCVDLVIDEGDRMA